MCRLVMPPLTVAYCPVSALDAERFGVAVLS